MKLISSRAELEMEIFLFLFPPNFNISKTKGAFILWFYFSLEKGCLLDIIKARCLVLFLDAQGWIKTRLSKDNLSSHISKTTHIRICNGKCCKQGSWHASPTISFFHLVIMTNLLFIFSCSLSQALLALPKCINEWSRWLIFSAHVIKP